MCTYVPQNKYTYVFKGRARTRDGAASSCGGGGRAVYNTQKEVAISANEFIAIDVTNQVTRLKCSQL